MLLQGYEAQTSTQPVKDRRFTLLCGLYRYAYRTAMHLLQLESFKNSIL